MFADLVKKKVSPVRFSSWKHCARRLAVKSQISLWRIDRKPPQGQRRACTTVTDVPQVQVEGRLDGNPVAVSYKQ